MAKFTISTDNVADLFKSFMDKNKIYCLPLKRVLKGEEFAEIFDSEKDYEKFYDGIKKGALAKTSQTNPEEMAEHIKSIFAKEKEGDLIHVSISSGLSGSYESCKRAADDFNKTSKGRKVYVIDSLSASCGMNRLIFKLMELRESTNAAEAVRIAEAIRDNLQVFFLVDDLFHLKRGGRVSAAKAVIGSILGVKPVLMINEHGKLTAIDKTRGGSKAIEWFLNKMKATAATPNEDFEKKSIFVLQTSKSELHAQLKKAIQEKYPLANVMEAQVGPIVGTHVGPGTVGIIFEGKPRSL